MDGEIIDAILVDLDEESAAWRAVQPKIERWRTLDRRTLQQKAGGFLGRRGFGYDAIRATIERIREENPPDESNNDV